MREDATLPGDREWARQCSLPPDELRARIATLRAELLPRVLATRKRDDGFTWDFANTPELREGLGQLVAFERQCCGGLAWTLDEPGDSGRLRLSVAGIDPDTQGLAAFRPPPERRGLASRLGSLAKAGGFGLAASFVVFCVLPLAVGAFGGAALAASLAQLDDPRLVAAGTALLALAAWLLLRHRAARAGA